MLLDMVQGALAAARYAQPQVGQRGPEFTGPRRVVDPAPLVVCPVDGRLDGGVRGACPAASRVPATVSQARQLRAASPANIARSARTSRQCSASSEAAPCVLAAVCSHCAASASASPCRPARTAAAIVAWTSAAAGPSGVRGRGCSGGYAGPGTKPPGRAAPPPGGVSTMSA
ncbi:hypothetical protein SAVCW2_35620 [Streptomyces avermitilis]|nr:hypothetical protein SAVCW2_35620 [Streptomyces avermitilis]